MTRPTYFSEVCRLIYLLKELAPDEVGFTGDGTSVITDFHKTVVLPYCAFTLVELRKVHFDGHHEQIYAQLQYAIQHLVRDRGWSAACHLGEGLWFVQIEETMGTAYGECTIAWLSAYVAHLGFVKESKTKFAQKSFSRRTR